MFNQNLKYRLLLQLRSNNISHWTIPIVFVIWMSALLLVDYYSAQLYFMIIIFLVAFFFKITRRVAVDGIYRFKVLLILVAVINIIQRNSLQIQSELLLKLINTLILSVLANYLTDFPKILKSIDYQCNILKPIYLRTVIRKIIYVFLIAVRFVPELWNIAEKLIEIKKMRGWQPKKQKYFSRLKETARLIIPLLILTGKKAVELETVFFLKGMQFSEKRTIWQAENPSWHDWGVVLVSGIVLLPIRIIN